ncbi:glycosyltransferase family 2 protein [Sphingobium yanoikuyae]|jgi:glycosyltransferase involved in cell wall biosynthesis|uniref:Glycosyltransferase family 2 protein n=1 Tax=Sphingobium yanoikuyae TaxID=13690 RepID=A0AA43B9E9_SPHYA|nr:MULTISPECIES: glycosyltransferase family 2 protein [Sphingobium]MDH2131068.1 glycosyltransferase family 2 protein [Sphingobium yanoikuyae]MDH2149192.1 glycosyltransferase family 2 protein [Sphingobium yanoikuyae]MDH2166977.1 glycosyltransferase family 2 protein [Sphingobium yanoikuyae]PHP16952.1 hypothetical protein CG471_25325 [Sphingobium sp. IP1]
MNIVADQNSSSSALLVNFDPEWYVRTYPDVAQIGMDPAEHYVWIGRQLGRRPNSGLVAPLLAAAPPAQSAPEAVLVAAPPAQQSDGGLPSMPQDAARWARYNMRIARQRPVSPAPLFRSFNPQAMHLHWIVSGELPLNPRQARIFSLIRQLEAQGHHSWIWIQPPCVVGDETAFRNALIAQGAIGPRTILRFLPEDVVGISGDAIIATDFWSCFPAAAMPLFKARFRLTQLLEKESQADGSASALAGQADALNMMALCAGQELETMLAETGRWTRHWPQFADDNYFYADPEQNPSRSGDTLQIAVDLGEAGTSHVAADLALDALELLGQRGIPFTAHLFGQARADFQPSYSSISHGPLESPARGDLFRACRIGLALATCLDGTTQSEMLACGLETIGLAQSQSHGSSDALHLTGASSLDIADAIVAISATPPRVGMRRGGADTKSAAQALELALREGLSVDNEAVSVSSAMMRAEYAHKAAVIIPTWNGGALFRDVLKALTTQSTPWSFEVMVVDSGSTDETLDITRSFENQGVRLHQIPNSEFQHGRTRNLAISLTSAEFVAVLTQDATPADQHWLANLVKAFDKGTKVAGVFGAHKAYPEATPFVSMGIDGHFEHFNRLPHVADWDGDHGNPIPFGSVPWQNWIHYYSDNNSCMRRSVWEKIPYPNIDWGEDQVWAWEIVKQGYEKAYAHDAIVCHSHNLNEDQQRKVSKIEGDFWLRNFNYRFESSAEQVLASADYLRDRNVEFALAHGISDAVRDEQIGLDRVAVAARYTGQIELLRDLYGPSA